MQKDTFKPLALPKVPPQDQSQAPDDDSATTGQERPLSGHLSGQDIDAIRLKARICRADIPTKFAAATVRDFQTPSPAHAEARNQVAAYLRAHDGKKWLLLGGPTGSGKTHLGVAALKALIAAGRDGLYINMPAMMQAARRSMDRDGSHDEPDIEDALESPVLMIDDFGAEKQTEWQREVAYDLINQRYEHEQATIITTNLIWPEELQKIYGDRIISRITEVSAVVMLALGDWRTRRP